MSDGSAYWRDCASSLVWERLGVPQDELEYVTGKRDVWAFLLDMMPLRLNYGYVTEDENEDILLIDTIQELAF